LKLQAIKENTDASRIIEKLVKEYLEIDAAYLPIAKAKGITALSHNLIGFRVK
jgi:hypothetical protein